MNHPFNVKTDSSNGFVYKIIISGELRRGEYLAGVEWRQHLANAKSNAENKKILFDITDLTYWDTAGMADIVGTIVTINKSSKGTVKRAALTKTKLEHLLNLANLLKFAQRKFPTLDVEAEDIPILKDEEIKKFVEG